MQYVPTSCIATYQTSSQNYPTKGVPYVIVMFRGLWPHRLINHVHDIVQHKLFIMTIAPAGIPSVNCKCDWAYTVAFGLDFWHCSQGLTGPEWKGSNSMVVVGWDKRNTLSCFIPRASMKCFLSQSRIIRQS